MQLVNHTLRLFVDIGSSSFCIHVFYKKIIILPEPQFS